MTAEIAIMNTSAIALASDSAVTIKAPVGQKVYHTVQKLFRLSKRQPVGVMLYGNAAFMDVPWETIIKEYRAKLGNRTFDSLEDFSGDLLKFIGDRNPLFPKSQQDAYFKAVTRSVFTAINNDITEGVQEVLNKKKSIGPGRTKKIASDIITTHHEYLQGLDRLPTMPSRHARRLKKLYEDIIQQIQDNVFQRLPIFKKDEKKLQEIPVLLFSRDVFPGNISGIVIAGFGTQDAFPKLQAYKVETIVDDKLKYAQDHHLAIDFENIAFVVPFAQSDMVHAFMEGIDPELHKVQREQLASIFKKYPNSIVKAIKGITNAQQRKLTQKLKEASEILLEDYQKELNAFREHYFIRPVTRTVSLLPKDELAAMAEALVNLTSFKQRVTIGTETVGGPIDVAVISKGDGFIWIKRKYYFDRQLNPAYFATHYSLEGAK